MAKETRIQAGAIGDSKYYYASDGTIVDEAGKPAPAKFANMFPPMPKDEPVTKQRRSLKELAGKIGNSKYFFQPDGTVVNEAGEPATEKLQQIFSKREELQKNLPKFNKLSDAPDEKTNVDQLETAFTDTIQTASKIVKVNELSFRKMPIALDGMRGIVKTLSEQNYLIIRKMMQQNDEFRDKIVEQITGVKGPSKSGGAVTRPTRGPMPVSGSRAAKATAVKSKIRRSEETKSTRFRDTRRAEVEARASRIATIRAKRNIVLGTAAAAAGVAAGAGLVLGTNYLGGGPAAAPGGAPGGGPGGTSSIGTSPVSGMVTIKTVSGKSFVVAEQYAQNFKGFVDELEATGYKINSIGGYANRNIAGSNQKSFHSLGVAIDINPSSNPHLFDGRLVTDMPPNISGMARKYGLGWGGDWRSYKDAMHFSIASAEGGSLAIDRSGVSPLPGAPQIAGADSRLPIGGGGPSRVGSATIAAAPSTIPGTGMGSPSGRIAGGESFDSQAPALMSRLQSDFGLTREQAAGILGNLGHESAGLQAGIQERGVTRGRGGLGWAQWTGPRRRSFEAYLERTGQSATDPEANYGFMKEELNTTHKRSLIELKKTNDVQSAMMVFEKHYEAAGVKHYEGRMRYAQRAMDLTGGTITAATPSIPVGGGGPAASTVGPQAAPERVATGTGGVGGLAGAGGQNPVSGATPPPNVTLGNNVDVSQVDPDLLQRFYQAAQEYGKPVTINSGYRGDDYQAELWVRANIFREPGIYSPAKPRNTTTITYQGKQYTVEGGGRGSAHGRGQALDVSPGPALDPFLRAQGLHRPHAAFDPPHVQKIGGEEYAAASQAPAGTPQATTPRLPTGGGGPPPSAARPQAAPALAPLQQSLAALSQRNAVQESAGQGERERLIIVNNDRTVNNTRTIYQRPSYSPSAPRAETVNPLALAGVVAGLGLARALRIF
jgi:hypothetical protein